MELKPKFLCNEFGLNTVVGLLLSEQKRRGERTDEIEEGWLESDWIGWAWPCVVQKAPLVV